MYGVVVIVECVGGCFIHGQQQYLGCELRDVVSILGRGQRPAVQIHYHSELRFLSEMRCFVCENERKRGTDLSVPLEQCSSGRT